MGSPISAVFKKRAITWTLLIVFLILAFFGIVKLGMHFSSDILHQLVKRETNGYYQLSFKEMRIDLLARSIQLEGVLLKPDSSKDFQSRGLHVLYDLELSGINIDLESIASIYLDKQLAIRNVRIIDPKIHLIKAGNAPEESFSLQTGNLYREISDYLRVLRIDVFSIDNAEFKHFPSHLGLGNIDFFISNLLIDSASRPDQKFYSESIELEIRNQSFKLNDSIHQVSFDRLLLSTTDSVLTFDNLDLKPITKDLGTFQKHDDKIVYDISIPQLRLKGVDYFSAYRNNHLEMEELSLTDSHIYLEEQTHSQKQRTNKGNSLIKQLIKVFDEIKIGKMRLINANLDLTTNDDFNHNYQHIKSKRADIVLYNVLLDSTNYHFDHRAKYFENVDIIIKEYSSYLPDSIHTIGFDLLELSSFDSSLVFKNFDISNNRKGSDSDVFINIDLPLLAIKGMNFLDAFVHQKLMIQEMSFQNPDITFEKSATKHQKKTLLPGNVYKLIADHFNQVGIQEMSLSQGTFSINQKINFDKADLLISNFNIDEDSRSWYDVLEEIELELHHLNLNDQVIDLSSDRLILDRKASRLNLEGLSIDIQNNNISFNSRLSNLSISGIDLDSISMGEYLAFDTVRLTEPLISFETTQSNANSGKTTISGSRYIEIIDGKIDGKIGGVSAFSCDKFNTSLSLGASNYIHKGVLEQLDIALSSIPNQLHINEISFSESQDVLMSNVEISSTQDTLSDGPVIFGKIPLLNIYGIDQEIFWSNNNLVGDSIIINAPDLYLDMSTAIDKTEHSDGLFSAQFQKIKMNNSQILYTDEDALEKIEASNLSISLDAFHFPSKSIVSPEHLLYSDNVILTMKDFQPTLANGDSIIVGGISFNKEHGNVSVDSIRYHSKDGSSSALLPFINVTGLNLHALINEQKFILDSILLSESQITIDLNISPTNEQESKETPESVDIKFFSSDATEIILKDSLNPDGYAIHKGRFEVHGFETDGAIDWNLFFDYAQYAEISGERLMIPLEDTYNVSIDQYSLKYPANSLSLNNVTLTSELTADEYSSQLKSQKDWFNVDVQDITLLGFDLERLLYKKEFYSEIISLGTVNAQVYRDKSVPSQTSIVKELPKSILSNIDSWILIDTLNLTGDITYREKPARKEEIAEISFNDLNASLFNITTVDSLYSRPMHLISTGRLIDTANFEIDVIFDMKDPNDQFVFTGKVDKMQLTAMNKMLRPIANINIKDGYADQIEFSINANKDVARGEMDFRYKNLKIQILNPETHDLKGLNQGIMTFFANTFVVKHKNPNFIFLRPGKIFYERDSSRAIFNYWGKSLLSGAVSSVGINKSKRAEKRYGKTRRSKQ